MKILADTAVRAASVAAVAGFGASWLSGQLDAGDVFGAILRAGIALFLGLLAFRSFGPPRRRRFDRALFPVLYAWLFAPPLQELWQLVRGHGFSLQQLLWGWLQVEHVFVLSFLALFLLSYFWRPPAPARAESG